MKYNHLIYPIAYCIWRAQLPPTAEGGPYKITAVSEQGGVLEISDVLFGDVWMCGGQSNMVFTVSEVSFIKE